MAQARDACALRRRGGVAALAVGLVMALGVAGQAPPAADELGAAQPVAVAEPAGLEEWLRRATSELDALSGLSDAVLREQGVTRLLRLYLDVYETIEGWYGPGAPYGADRLSEAVTRGEQLFHSALQPAEPAVLRERVNALRAAIAQVQAEALRAGVPLVPDPSLLTSASGAAAVSPRELRTAEIRSIDAALRTAAKDYAAGNAQGALHGIEQAYLQQFEPLEARLPGPVVRRIESLIHLQLRPLVSRNASVAMVQPVFTELYAALVEADAALARGGTFWFGAANAFAIIMREGLEAVLLIGAILAYMSGMGVSKRERNRVWAGAVAGVAASFGTWILARTLLPVSGASREIIEGVTALVAVAVLIYVSNWLFQKTYIHDWKNYLRERIGHAVTTGSAVAMAGLAFAAVYREGFETVLFYQALLYESSSGAVLAGFAPGLLLILAIGAAIIRAGVKLPLRKLFAVTNGILVYLAFVFVGKGLYNLQEAGLFAPHPVSWAPDAEVLRQFLGFYPTVETVVAQLAFIVLIGSTYAYYRSRQLVAPAREEVREQSRPRVSVRA